MSPPKACPRDCALQCQVTDWAHLLADAPDPGVRLYYAIVGVPRPLDPSRWRECFRAFEATHGLDELLRGLRLAADQPPMSAGGGGAWTAELRGRVCALLERYEQVVRGRGAAA